MVGADPDTDLAVLKLGSLRNLPTAVLAPDKGLRVGDVVLAIGNPFGVGQTRRRASCRRWAATGWA